MRDINFFKPYKDKDKGGNSRYYYQIIMIGLFGIIILITSVNICRMMILDEEIKNYESKLNKEDVKEKEKLANEVNRKLDALTKYENDIDIVTNLINKKDIVKNSILDDISSTLPQNVSFKSMNIGKDVISIQAITTNRQAVGELEHNLYNINYIKNVHVDSISSNDSVKGEYVFNIKCYLDGGGE